MIILKSVVKADGRVEGFDKEKLVRTALRAGASSNTAKKIASLAESKFPDMTSTHQIYKFVLDELDKISYAAASIFGLREAIAELDSESFEKYSMKVLEANGYNCEWNKITEGRNIEHQIDVIAKNSLGHVYYVECKRHQNPHRFCGLEVPLEVQARLEDLREGFIDGKNPYNFSAAWIFTNTKFSEHAKLYAKRKGIMMTGWSSEISLQELIENHRVYPITLLKTDAQSKAKMLESGIITLQDLLSSRKTDILRDLVQKARDILKRYA